MEKRSTINILLLAIIHFISIIPASCNTCFYNKIFALFGASGTPTYPQVSDYQFDINWGSTQSPIINSSFYWRGFSITTQAKLVSFDASLGMVTQTSAVFFFNPTVNSEVFYIQFGVLLLKSCTNAINLIFYQQNNCSLRANLPSQTLSITLGSTFLADTSGYITQAILSSFTLQSPDSDNLRLTLYIDCLGIVAGSNKQDIALRTFFKNITKVAFTYISIYVPNIVPVVYSQTFAFPTLATNQVKVPESFNARKTFDCIVGLKNLDTQDMTAIPFHSITLKLSNSTDLAIFYEASEVQILSFQYTRICLGGDCPNGSQIDKTANDYVCNPCDYYMPSCTSCSAYNVCNSCNQSYFLNLTLNDSCHACPTYCLNCSFISSMGFCSLCEDHYYIDPTSGQCSHCPIDCQTCSSNTTCLSCYFGWPVNGGCTNQSQCISVTNNVTTINKCLSCSESSSLVNGYCVDTLGCVTENSTGNVSICLFCDISANFQRVPINNSCFCIASYVLSKKLNNSCIACPSNCLVCEQKAGVALCSICTSNFTAYIPTNLSCLAMQPNCISWEIISGIVSCLLCQNKTFPSVPTSAFDYIRTCIPCLIDCSSCTSDQTCSTCLYEGWPVIGGCTRIPQCLEVKKNDLSTSKCLRCDSKNNYQLKIGLCVNITGCIVPKMFDNNIICLSCDSSLLFKPVPINSTCICTDGYSLNQNKTACRQICGDGIVYVVQCDDGNLQDGDGCSSLCKVEDNFGCVVDMPLTPSRCIYLKYDIKLKVTKISKKFMENKGTFTFSLTPNLNIFKSVNFSSALSFYSNRSFTIQSTSIIGFQLAITVVFKEDLQDYFASLQLSLSSLHFLQKKAIVNFYMISGDSKLIFIKDLKKIKLCGDILYAISILFVCAFMISSSVNKMMGLETIFPLQIFYLVHLISRERYPCFGLIAYLGSTAYNYFFQGLYHPYVQQECVATIFDKKQQSTTLWVMFGLMLVSLISIVIFYSAKILMAKNQVTEKVQQSSNSFIQTITRYSYNNILFPFLIATFLIFWPILMIRQNHIPQNISVLPLLQAIILSIIFSIQFKQIFLQSNTTPTKLNYYRKAKKWYIPIFLINVFVTTLLFSLAFIDFSLQMEPYILAIQSLYFMFILFFWPYQSNLDNMIVIFNNASIVIYLAWDIIRNYNAQLRSEENQFVAIQIIIMVIGIMLICSTIRIITEIIGLIRQRKQKIEIAKNIVSVFQQSIIINNRGEQKLTKDEFETSRQFDYMKKYGMNVRDFDKGHQIPLSFFEKSIKTENEKSSKMKFLKNYLLHKQEYQI